MLNFLTDPRGEITFFNYEWVQKMHPELWGGWSQPPLKVSGGAVKCPGMTKTRKEAKLTTWTLTRWRPNALRVKPHWKGEIKVFKIKTFWHIQLWSKNIQTFFKWCQTLKSLWFRVLSYFQIFVKLFAKKHEGGGWEVWNFVCWPISSY